MRHQAILPLCALACALIGCAGFGGTRRQAPESAAAAASPPLERATPPSAAPAVDAAPAARVEATPATAAPAAPEAPHKAHVAPAKPAAAAGTERYVSLNFDNADISVVIQTVAELLHLNYIVAPTVRGRITIQTTDKLPVSSLLPVLEQILAVNNFTAVKSGDFYKIVPASQAKQESVETVAPDASPTVGTGLVTKIVQLRYISPGEVVKILTPFKTAAGIYQAHEAARLLFLTESPAKIGDLLKIIEVLDVDGFAAIQVELCPVRYAGVEDLAQELTQIVTQVFSAAGRGRSMFRIVPVPKLNAIMVFSGEAGLAANIREWIAKLDQPGSDANERIFVYPLSHATAETLAAVIEKVFRVEMTQAKTRTSVQPAPQQPAARATPVQQPGVPQIQHPPSSPMPAVQTSSGGVAVAGAAPVVVVADKDTNTLIIQTASWFYPKVQEVIGKLDVMPRQVLIEMLIAEITLDDSNQFGIQWALKGRGSIGAFGETHSLANAGELSALVPKTAFSLLVTESNRLAASLNAYAQDSKLNILSAPHILATNNKEAKIDIGAEVPILKTMTTPTTGIPDPTNTVTNDIEYRSTGVILTVTPHVNEGGYVTLDLQQEVSEAQENTLGGTTSPIIRKRTAKTTMVVKDNQTLVVGGLIQETRTNSREGLPWLSRVPILGYLFGSHQTKVSKTELVIFITPRVVNDVEEGDRLTRQIKDRVLTLKKGIDEFGSVKGEGAR